MARGRAGRWGRAIAAAGIASYAAACSFVTSLDGLTGGAPDAAPPEDSTATLFASGGTTPADDGGPHGDDASNDAATLEDSALDADAAPPSAYCASLSPQPLFCDDFDENTADAAALAAAWDQVTGLGGSVQRSGKVFTSPTLAMLVTSTAEASSIDLCGYKSFDGGQKSGQELTLAFDLYVQQADTTKNSDAVLSAIELIDPLGDRWALQLEVSYPFALGADAGVLDVNFSQNATVVGDASPGYISYPVATTLPIGAWTRVTMEVTIGLTDTATLHFGTKEVASQIPVTSYTIDGHPEILVGGTYAQKSTLGWTVRYDDVTFDVQ